MVESFNKILESALKNICNTKWNDWGVRIPTDLWAYNTSKKLTSQTPLRLANGKEDVMPMEYNFPSLRIATVTDMVDCNTLEE